MFQLCGSDKQDCWTALVGRISDFSETYLFAIYYSHEIANKFSYLSMCSSSNYLRLFCDTRRRRSDFFDDSTFCHIVKNHNRSFTKIPKEERNFDDKNCSFVKRERTLLYFSQEALCLLTLFLHVAVNGFNRVYPKSLFEKLFCSFFVRCNP